MSGHQSDRPRHLSFFVGSLRILHVYGLYNKDLKLNGRWSGYMEFKIQGPYNKPQGLWVGSYTYQAGSMPVLDDEALCIQNLPKNTVLGSRRQGGIAWSLGQVTGCELDTCCAALVACRNPSWRAREPQGKQCRVEDGS